MVTRKVVIGEILPAELEIGVPLPYTVYDRNHNLLLNKGAILASRRQLDALLDRGLYRVDEVEGPVELPDSENPLVRLDRLCRELNTLIAAPSRGEGSFELRTVSIATRLGALCAEHPDAVLAGMLHDRQTRYAVRHMAHSGVVAQLIADAIGLPQDEGLSVVCAALTMNLPILDLQNDLVAMPARTPSEEERRRIHDHPQAATEALVALGVGDPLWLGSVAQHHEAWDGSGYPGGISGTGIALGARIVGLADRYIARLRDRADRPGQLPNECLRDIFVSRGAEVDPQLAQFLVKVVGIYPPGLIVELENGEIGVVVRRGGAAHAPEVAVVVAHERLLSEPERRLTENAPFRVRNAVAPEATRFRFDPLAAWREA